MFEKIFGTYSDKKIKQMRPILDKINAYEKKVKEKTDAELKQSTFVFMDKISSGVDPKELMPEIFATLREASVRTLGMRHYDSQILCAIALCDGCVSEMKTGEGKTLAATLAAYFNAVCGNHVYVVTVNDYLAKRDAEWMKNLYEFLGLSVSYVIGGMYHEERKLAYNSNIVYVTNNELGFDYLRDNMALTLNEQVLASLDFAIIDEADSILIDESRTPLIISGKGTESTALYQKCSHFVRGLTAGTYKELTKIDLLKQGTDEDGDYIYNEKDKQIHLTENGLAKAERYFGVDNIGDIENVEILHGINTALRAHYVMFRDQDYIVKDNEVLIVDEFTGRIMPGRRYSDGLHQAIEAKENVKINNENQTLASITFQNFFNKFKNKSGMTGTAITEKEEFLNIYNMDVVVIPTNKPVIRQDLEDAVYKNHKAKINAIVDEIKEANKNGQPVLVGTITVEASEELSNILRKKGIKHKVLNAKHHEKEAEIVAQAGRYGAVTIATNMAGRGTDILLGGNPEYEAKAEMARNKFTDEEIYYASSVMELDAENLQNAREVYNELYEKYKLETDKEQEKVIEVGGLYIIGTERHESRRIDNQLRGRAGRQGDPGKSKFFISLDDDLIRLFTSDKLIDTFNNLNIPNDIPIEHKMLSNAIERAQKRIEGNNFGIRKNLFEYDMVMNTQREIVYKERQSVLNGEDMSTTIRDMIDKIIDDIIDFVVMDNTYAETWDYLKLSEFLNEIFPIGSISPTASEMDDWGKSKNSLRQYVKDICHNAYNKKEAEFIIGFDGNSEPVRELERSVLLRVVDAKWALHIDEMDRFKQGVGLQAYGQKEPIVAYRSGAFDMFEEMSRNVRETTIKTIFSLKRVDEKQEKREIKDFKKEIKKNTKIGRNEPCPCGSGKKYKQCCGRN